MDYGSSIAPLILGYILARQGDSDEAIAIGERELRAHGRYPLSLTWAGVVYALAGRDDAAQGVLKELEAIAAKTNSAVGPLTIVNCVLGNVDQAFHWAERAIDQRDPQLIGLKSTPMFEILRSDPRYPALLKSMNLT